MNENQGPMADERIPDDTSPRSEDAASKAAHEDVEAESAETEGEEEFGAEADTVEDAELEAELPWTQYADGARHWERQGEAEATPNAPSEGAERVSKLMAKAGIASRRAAEEIIMQGRVSVNGHFVREPGAKADPLRDRIFVDNKPLILSDKEATVLLLHKPKYVMTTRDDQGKRTMVMDLLPHKYQKLHPVGRLDYETTGVLLLSDDGELTNLLTHPSHGVEKVYEARVRGEVTREEIARLEGGIYLDDARTAPCRVRVVAQREKNALVELSLFEGRNRQVRRMLEAIGHPASALRRIKFGGVELEGLETGTFRVLLPGEVKQLRKHAEEGLKVAKKRSKAILKPTGKPTRPGASKKATPRKITHPKVIDESVMMEAQSRLSSTENEDMDSFGAPPRERAPRKDTRASGDGRAPRSDTRAPRVDNSGNRAPRDTRAPRDDKRAPRSDTRAPGSSPRAPRDDKRMPRDDARAPRTVRAPRDDKAPRTPRPPRDDNKSPRPPRDQSRAPRNETRAPKDDKRAPRDEQSPLAKRIEKKWR